MAEKTNKKAKKQRSKIVNTPVTAGVAMQVVGTRGRTFEGFVTKKFPTRVVVEFERTVYVKKYQRFYKKKTRLHARLQAGVQADIGDYIRVRECRPLSKIIRFVVVEKVRAASEMGGKTSAPSASTKKEVKT